ncbi:hypothetical protein TRICI_003216 [Trichomonascus ciferrii]|uniref:Uncharacterized protein n=1 Tax=Trichomonascus ciferrii TaxID=44093 RepID=A0A642V5Q4_9ASCO|nr:hypothetical protein TRICI_003216 [Trichomonascus ciferrii]
MSLMSKRHYTNDDTQFASCKRQRSAQTPAEETLYFQDHHLCPSQDPGRPMTPPYVENTIASRNQTATAPNLANDQTNSLNHMKNDANDNSNSMMHRKVKFMMGYRPDCKLCQLKVPGHYAHWSNS